MDKAVLLLSQYCDNDLSPEEQVELDNWLKLDAAHVDRFTRALYLNSLLHDLIKEQGMQSDAWSHALGADEPFVPQTVPAAVPSGRWSKKFLASIAVAALLTGLAVFTAILISFGTPTVVAQVSSLHGTALNADGQPLLAGALLAEGQLLQVDTGNVLVTFECGAKVLVEGPALFVVENTSTGTLKEGKLSTRIPTQAIGFAIRTPLLDIVDLGTEFQFELLSEREAKLHVFDGLVEVRLGKQFEHANDGVLRISEGRSLLFQTDTNEIINLQYDESLKKQF